MHYLEEEPDDPILSVVNIIDVFLVIIVVLVIMVAQNPLNPLNAEDVVVTNPGKDDMSITVKKGEKLERYESTGAIGEGAGIKAGVTYRMDDGSLVYVPESD
jgi:hypothetical protein